jgi:DNA-binding NarL/FixJ family response regulator
LYPPSNVVNREKRETVKNLHDSGMSEELIAEQLDLNVDTVKIIVKDTGM